MMRCKFCGGMLKFLGLLGFADWYKCNHCGFEWTLTSADPGDYLKAKEKLDEHYHTCSRGN